MSSFSRRRREELFASIARGKGGAAGLLLDPEVLIKAQMKLEELKPMATAEIRSAIGRIRTMADDQAGPDQIFSTAHEIKGLAGTYGFASVGMVAGAIRAYAENRPQGFQPDWALLQLLTHTMARTFDDPDAAPPQVLATMCREAVAKVMTREGREIPEGAL
jgi:chemotaxis protein histidine kinase CheA